MTRVLWFYSQAENDTQKKVVVPIEESDEESNANCDYFLLNHCVIMEPINNKKLNNHKKTRIPKATK